MNQSNDASIGLLAEDAGQNYDFDSLSKSRSVRRLLPTGWSQKIQSRTKTWSGCALLIVVLPLAVWGLIDASSRLLHWSRALLHGPTPDCWCGTSNEEAMAMGCRYDHLAVDWLPQSCIDDELVKEFDTSGPGPNGVWPYFEKESRPLSGVSFTPINATEIDTFASEGTDYFATKEWHILHCMFTWRKQFRAGFSGKSIEPWNNKEEHIIHCSNYILGAIRMNGRLDEIETIIVGADRHTDE